jgi:hypothetical protein
MKESDKLELLTMLLISGWILIGSILISYNLQTLIVLAYPLIILLILFGD